MNWSTNIQSSQRLNSAYFSVCSSDQEILSVFKNKPRWLRLISQYVQLYVSILTSTAHVFWDLFRTNNFRNSSVCFVFERKRKSRASSCLPRYFEEAKKLIKLSHKFGHISNKTHWEQTNCCQTSFKHFSRTLVSQGRLFCVLFMIFQYSTSEKSLTVNNGNLLIFRSVREMKIAACRAGSNFYNQNFSQRHGS